MKRSTLMIGLICTTLMLMLALPPVGATENNTEDCNHVVMPEITGGWFLAIDFFPDNGNGNKIGSYETRGRALAANERFIYLQKYYGTGVGSGTWQPEDAHGYPGNGLPGGHANWIVVAEVTAGIGYPQGTGSMDPSFIRISPDGTIIALGMGYNQPLLVFPISVLDPDNPSLLNTAMDPNVPAIPGVTVFPWGATPADGVQYYEAEWVPDPEASVATRTDGTLSPTAATNNTHLAISTDRGWSPNNHTGTGGVIEILDTTSPANRPVETIRNIGYSPNYAASGGVAVDKYGNLITGQGYDYSDPTSGETGQIKIFFVVDWTNAWPTDPNNPTPMEYDHTTNIVADKVLSAASLGVDNDNNLHAGGGDVVSGFLNEMGFAALIDAEVLADALSNLGPVDESDGALYRELQPDKYTDDSVTFSIYNPYADELAVLWNPRNWSGPGFGPYDGWYTGVQPILTTYGQPAKNDGTPDAGDNSWNNPDKSGDPVQVSTGNNFRTETDIPPGPVPMSLSFKRYYNSRGQTHGVLGHGWRHTFEYTVEERERHLVAWRPSGRAVYFNARTLAAESGSKKRLAAVLGGGWTLTNPDRTVETYDAGGRLLHIADPNDNRLTLTYGAPPNGNRLDRVADPFGRELVFTYRADGLLDTVTDPAGKSVAYDYHPACADGRCNLREVRLPVTDTETVTREYRYEGPFDPHNLTGVIDENGRTFVTFAYDAEDRAVLSTYPQDAYRTDFEYEVDGDPRTTRVTDGRNNVTTYRFTKIQGIYLIESVTGPACADCGGRDTVLAWDPVTLDLASRTVGGVTTRYVDYDEWGNARTITRAPDDPALARTVTRVFDPAKNLLTRMTLPGAGAGRTRDIDYFYDPNGNLERIVDTGDVDGQTVTRTTTFGYNARGQLVSTDGPRTQNDVYTRTYDPNTGVLLSVTAPLSGTTGYADHDAHGRPLTVTDANEVATALVYDLRGRLTRTTTGGAVTRLAYNPDGTLHRITDPTGVVETYSYDPAHRLTETTDMAGNRRAYTLNTEGGIERERIFKADGTGVRTLDRVYDAYNRMARETDLWGAWQYDYDGDGRLSTVTTPRGHATTYHHDALGRLEKITEPHPDGAGDPPETIYAHDPQDNLAAVTDAHNRTTTYTRDDFGNLLARTSPDTGATRWTYDAAGNPATRTDANQVTALYTFDAENRLTHIDYPGAGHDVTFTYDQGAHGKGRLTGMTDRSGAYQYTYDRFGNRITEQRTLDGQTHYLHYEYDAAGRLTAQLYPDGLAVVYHRNPAGDVTGIDAVQHGATRTVLSNVEHMPFGPVRRMVFGNGLETLVSVDQSYRISAMSTGTIQNDTLLRNPNGHVTGITDNLPSGNNRTFAFDNLDRLQTATAPTGFGTIQYEHDLTGNRTSMTRSAGTRTYTYTPGTSRLTGIQGLSPATFVLDPAGNTTTLDTRTLTYGPDNRLEQIQEPGAPDIHYTTNGLGRRVKKTVGAATTVFHYDYQGRLIAEHTPDNTHAVNYIYLGNTPIAAIHYEPDTVARCRSDCNDDGNVNLADYAVFRSEYERTDCAPATPCQADFNGDGVVNLADYAIHRSEYGRSDCPSPAIYYYHTDHLGTPRKMTDAAGAVVWAADYLPFGQANVTTNTVENNLRFPGQYYDTESGLHYNYHRYYDPDTGRYLSADPIGLEGGINLFAYVGNNPIMFFDLLGLCPEAYNSGWLLRGLVPGQIAWDNALNAYALCLYDDASIYFSAMVFEQLLFAFSVGQTQALFAPTRQVTSLASKSGSQFGKNTVGAAQRALPEKFSRAMKSRAERIATGRDIRKVDELVQKFGGKAKKWKKMKTTDDWGQEIHYYEHHGIGKVGIKFKGDPDPF